MSESIPEQRAIDPVRTYRTSRGWNAFLMSLAMIAIAGSSAGLWWSVGDGALSGSGRLLLGTICAAFLLFGAYMLVWPIRAKVVLSADSLTSVEVFTRTEISRTEVSGWRLTHTTPPMLRLERKGKGAVKIALTFPVDQSLDDWLDGLPCLDQKDMDRERDELAADQNLGLTPKRRSQSLERAKKEVRVLTVASVAACLWGIFYPHPYSPAMLVQIILPWVGVEMTRRWHGVIRIDEKRNQVRPSVATAVMFPGFVLALRAASDINVIFTAWAMTAMAIATALLILALFSVDSTLKSQRGTAISICFLMVAYGYGAVLQADTLLDRKPAQIYRAIVAGKHVASGKTTSYYIDPQSWGPDHKALEIEVGRQTFDAIAVGDTADIALRHGALGVQWYYLAGWNRGTGQ